MPNYEFPLTRLHINQRPWDDTLQVVVRTYTSMTDPFTDFVMELSMNRCQSMREIAVALSEQAEQAVADGFMTEEVFDQLGEALLHWRDTTAGQHWIAAQMRRDRDRMSAPPASFNRMPPALAPKKKRKRYKRVSARKVSAKAKAVLDKLEQCPELRSPGARLARHELHLLIEEMAEKGESDEQG